MEPRSGGMNTYSNTPSHGGSSAEDNASPVTDGASPANINHNGATPLVALGQSDIEEYEITQSRRMA